MIDVTQQINAVQRRVGTRVLEAGEARTVTISQTYAATIEDVWDACTSAERIPRWFLPVSGELKLGGRYQLEGNAGGTIEGCDPPKSFFATWEYGGEVSWVDVTLSAETDRTRLLLVHTAAVPPDFWDRFGPGAVGIGWEMMLWGLHEHLTSPDMPRAELDAWLASPEGHAYHVEVMTGSNAAWAEASIADGTDPGAAREAADRCLAAYTAEPEG